MSVFAVRKWAWLGTLPMLGVGLIEEAAKLVVPAILVVFFGHRHRSSIGRGIVIGVAVGTGFAVLETMGYAFVALLQSGGDVGAAEQTLFVRGLLSPAGHAAWDGIAGIITYAAVGAISIGLLLFGLRQAQRADAR